MTSRNRQWWGLGVSALCVLGFALPSLAQDEDPASATRNRRFPGGRAEQRPLDMDKLIQAMDEQMELTDTQYDQIVDLADQFDADMAALEDSNEPSEQLSLEDQKARLRELMDEQVAARRSGDKEKVQEVREKLQSLRGGGSPRKKLEDQFVANVSKVLDTPQRRQFRDIVTTMRDPTKDPEYLKSDPSALQRAVSKLNLSQDQRAEIDEYYRGYLNDRRELEPTDMVGTKDLALNFHDEVMQVLTEDQKVALFSAATGQRAAGRMPTDRLNPNEAMEGQMDEEMRDEGEIEDDQ